MSVVEYIVLSFALGMDVFTVMQQSAQGRELRLSKGLLGSFIASLVVGCLFCAGMAIGGVIRFSPGTPDPNAVLTNELLSNTDNLVYLGLMIFVALRYVFTARRREKQNLSYDVTQIKNYVLIALMLGVNALIVGLAVGFRYGSLRCLFGGIIVAVMYTVLSFVGIMFGRQRVEIHARRWLLIASLVLLAFALKGVLWK